PSIPCSVYLTALFCLFVYPFTCYPFFYTHPAPTQIYTLSLHDALPIFDSHNVSCGFLVTSIETSIPLRHKGFDPDPAIPPHHAVDRKSTRLNSSHEWISYAVFCLKKKKNFRSTRTMLPVLQY